MENRKIFLYGVLLCCLSLPVHAGMYKWYDEEGNVHYTQKPPPKNGERAAIDTSTFNSVDTVKAPAIPKTTTRRTNAQPQTSTKKEQKKKTRRKGCKFRK